VSDRTGACRRRAPCPSYDRDEVAHWAHTFHEDYCGEWCASDAAAPTATLCRDCAFWSYAAGGLQPVDRRDQLPEWWRRAGHCLRFAPRPSELPGHKAFWRATHESDRCFEGKPAPR
jgi:hypothetical protein